MKSFELIQSQSIKKLLQDAENGDAEAQWRLGEAYREGKEVKQDFVEAVKWFRLAADQGLDQAQYSLGLAYWHAEGVGLDRAEAVKWIQLAAEQGHDLSIEFLAKL